MQCLRTYAAWHIALSGNSRMQALHHEFHLQELLASCTTSSECWLCKPAAQRTCCVQVQAAMQVTQQLMDSQSPGVAALMLHRLQQQAGRCWGQTTGDQQALKRRSNARGCPPTLPVCMMFACARCNGIRSPTCLLSSCKHQEGCCLWV